MFTHTDNIVPQFYVDLLNIFDSEVLPYSRGNSDFSVTSLFRDPLETQLTARNPGLPKEALDGISALEGTMLHWGMEQAARIRGDQAETRRFVTIDVGEPYGKVVFSGSSDYEGHDERCGNVMLDWKRCKDYAIVFGAQEGNGSILIDGKYYKEDWVYQLNMNRWLAREATKAQTGNGEPAPVFYPEMMFIGAWIVNWDRNKALEQEDYPTAPMQFIKIPPLPDSEVEYYMKQRIRYHLKYKDAPIEAIPICSEKARWTKDHTWKVYDTTSEAKKPRSKKNFDNEAEALLFANEASKKSGKLHVVKLVPGEDTKCVRYCDVRSICPYGKDKAEEEPWRILSRMD